MKSCCRRAGNAQTRSGQWEAWRKSSVGLVCQLQVKTEPLEKFRSTDSQLLALHQKELRSLWVKANSLKLDKIVQTC